MHAVIFEGGQFVPVEGVYQTITTESSNPNVPKVFTCPICKRKLTKKEALYSHMYDEHIDDIPEGMSAAQFLFNLRNKKTYGTCVQCRTNRTPWNEKAERYDRFCSEQCRNAYVIEAKRRMVATYGKPHILDDPEHQRKMANSRSTSGFHIFHEDNTQVVYRSSYEKDFLEFIDISLDFTGNDVMECVETFEYELDGETHVYIPDYYIPSFNLIVEIKDGGDNPNNHHKIQSVDKPKEALKDETMRKQNKFSYIKIVNKDYRQFVEVIKLIQLAAFTDPEFKDRSKSFIIIPE